MRNLDAMEKTSFGEILRQTRERKGLDLNATARRLRIRPDILQAIEESNFRAMPPRGYARNMVNGYARYLGLNPTEITGMYLDELYAYQIESESRRQRPTGIDMPSSQRHAARSSNRRVYYERDERESARAHVREQQNQQRQGLGRSSRGDRLYPESRTHQARGTALPTTNYSNFYSGPGALGFLQTYWRYIVAGLVGLIIVALVLSQVFSCSRKTETEEVPNVPVTGVEETASSVSSAATQAKAPTNFTMEYTVASGEVSWIEVYVDGQIQVGESVEGPETRSFTSSDSIQFITANPTPVTVKIDGEEVELELDDTGVVNMTWNFSDILAKWLADHPGVKAASTLDTVNLSSEMNAAQSDESTDATSEESGGTTDAEAADAGTEESNESTEEG